MVHVLFSRWDNTLVSAAQSSVDTDSCIAVGIDVMRERIPWYSAVPPPICAVSLHMFLSCFFFSVILSSLRVCGFSPAVDRVVCFGTRRAVSRTAAPERTHCVRP